MENIIVVLIILGVIGFIVYRRKKAASQEPIPMPKPTKPPRNPVEPTEPPLQ